MLPAEACWQLRAVVPRLSVTVSVGVHAGDPVRISSTVSRERRADPDSEHPTPPENLSATCRQLAGNLPASCRHVMRT